MIVWCHIERNIGIFKYRRDLSMLIHEGGKLVKVERERNSRELASMQKWEICLEWPLSSEEKRCPWM